MEQSLAYEMLGELKRANKRIFIITIVEFIIIVSMIIGFSAHVIHNQSGEIGIGISLF